MSKLMGHIVAGYPTMDLSRFAAFGIIDSGAAFLEVQFPFSDPNADGVAIQNACNVSIENGFKTNDGFSFIRQLNDFIKLHNYNTKLLIVTYANIIFKYGLKDFVKKAKNVGVWGIIVPDLPIESDEGLAKIAKKQNINVISLIAPHTNANRIKLLDKKSNGFVYVVARAGITGDKTKIDSNLFKWIDFVKKHCKHDIALGFGINSNEQVKALQDRVEIIVAGSYFVNHITTLHKQNLQGKEVQNKMCIHARNLMNWS